MRCNKDRLRTVSDSRCPRGAGINQGDTMKSIGGLMFILGLGSFVLNYLGYQFTLLSWIDTWGPTTGIAIRAALIVIGGALWLLGNKREKAAAPAA